MSFQLEYLKDGRPGLFDLPEGEIVIGRKEYCDLCLTEAGVSKRHARIVRTGFRVEVFDAGSRNGTLVNGEEVEALEIQPGDVVQIGTVALTLREEAATSAGSLDAMDDFDDGDVFGEGGGGGKVESYLSGSQLGSRSSLKDSFDVISGEEVRVDAEPTGRLLIYDNGQTSELDCIPGRVVTIGTKEGNSIVLLSGGASRYHAEVYEDGKQWVVKDLGSRNGVFLRRNGEKEPRKVEVDVLGTGDEIQIGTSRMRFEEVKAGVKVDRVLQDPRAKPVLAGIVMLALAFIVVTGGPSGSGFRGNRTLPYNPSLLTATRHISKKEFSEAKKLLEYLGRAYPDQQAPKLLLRVADKWPEQQYPTTFSWGDAFMTLRELQKESDRLPKFVRLWVDTEAERVALNRDGFNSLREAQKYFEDGDAAARQNRVDAAIRSYGDALRLYRSVSPKSEFLAAAKEKAEAVRARLYDLHVKRAEAHFSSGNAEWNEAMRMFELAQNYTENPDNLSYLRTRMVACQINNEDEKKYQQAVEIVRGGRASRYNDALDLLLSINPKSNVSKYARAYITWIRCDEKVREAAGAYGRGEGERCLRLLNEVLRIEAIGPAARASVRKKRDAWSRIIMAYNEGRRAYLGGQDGYTRSQNLLKIVVKNEKDPSNYYRKRSLRMLDSMRVSTVGSDKNLMQRGFRALVQENLAEAHDYFDKIASSRTGKIYVPKIRRGVAKVSTRRQWLNKAYTDVLLRRNLKRYSWAREVFRLLKDYLPKDDRKFAEDRAKAEKYFNQIEKEIDRLGGTVDDR